MGRKKIRMQQLAEQPKTRKRRKPMTDEQKKAAAERLAKARAAKKKTSSAPKHVHPSVAAKPDSEVLCLKNVRDWIKHNKDLLSEERRGVRNKIKGSEANVVSIQGYISNMEKYIRTGDWVDSFYGKEGQNKTRLRCIAPAYHFEGPFKGQQKRTVGMVYDDVGEWTQEMHHDYYGENTVKSKPKYRRKRKKA